MLQYKLDVIMMTIILFYISNISPNWQIVIFTKTPIQMYMTDMHHLASVHTAACRRTMASGLKRFASLKIDDKIVKMRCIMQRWVQRQ